MSSTTEPTDPMDTAMDAALHANDMEAFHQAFGAFLHADRWMQTHVVHAMAACPAVLDYWLASVPKEGRAERLYRYTARALEDLSEEEKTELLLGKSSVPSRQNLYRYLKDPAQRWSSASPSWVGKPGSALREAALGLGWKPHDLPGMIVTGMQIPGWERWLPEFPYAYSIVAAHWLMLQRVSRNVHLLVAKREVPVLVFSELAYPSDVIVALAMLCLDGGELANNIRVPVSWKAPDGYEVQRLQDLVRLHWGMGLQQEFVQALREGRLPGQTAGEQVSLDLPTEFEAGNSHRMQSAQQ